MLRILSRSINRLSLPTLLTKPSLLPFTFSITKPSLTTILPYNFSSIQAHTRKKVAKKAGMKNCARNKYSSNKKRDKKRTMTNHKMATRKSMLKRIKICGPRWNPTFKFKSTAKLHLNRNRSRNNLRRKKQDKFISKADYKRVLRMIPYAKFKKFKDRH